MSFRLAFSRCNILVARRSLNNNNTLLVASRTSLPSPRHPRAAILCVGYQQQHHANFATTADKSGSGSRWSLNPMSMMSMDRESQFVKQMEDLVAAPEYNLGVHHDQLNSATKSMRVRLTGGIFGSQEVKDAKKSQKIAESMINFVGSDATADKLSSLERMDKLRIANDAGITVGKLEEEIQKFVVNNRIHRLVTFLKDKGKEIPKGPEQLRQYMEIYGPRLLTKKERKELEQQVMANMKQQYPRRK